MLNFLAQIQALDMQLPNRSLHPQIEPRRVRRQKAREAAKATRSLGAAAVPAQRESANYIQRKSR